MAADKSDFPLLERGEAVPVVAMGIPATAGSTTASTAANRLSRTVTVVTPTAPPMHWHLIWAGVAGNLAAVCGGFVYSWPSPSLPRLQDADAPAGFVITDEQASWVVSLTPLGGAFGTIPGGLFADRFGRRPTLICSAALMFVCWVMTGLANSAAWLYAARFIGGFVTGVVSCILPLYLGEIAVDRIRAALGCAMQLSLTLGFMLPYALGPFVSTTVLAVVLASCVAVYAATSLSLPESPYLLLLKGETEAASAALQWLRGQDRDQCYKELRRMEEETEACLARRCSVAKTFVRVFETHGQRKAFFLVCALMLFQQLSGINAVLSYAQDIFNRAAGGESAVSPAMSTIIVGLVLVVASASTVPITAGVSMKTLFIVSSLGAAAAHTALGYFFHLVRTEQDTSSLSALPVVSLVFFIVVYCLGLGSVPWALLGEVFVADVKAASSSLCASFYWAVGFLVTLFFKTLMDRLGADLTFWGLAACCVLAAVFTLALVPNTKGKSLQEIQDILNGRDASALPATPRLSRLLRDQ